LGALALASLLSITSLWSFWSLWSLPQSLPLPQASAHALRAAAAQTGTLEAWHPATADGILFLPVLDGLGDGTACDTSIVVQNVGQDISKAALITWSTPGDCPPQSAGPLKVECTGLLKPGTTWTLSGGQVPTGSHSGVLFSFTAKLLSEIDVDLGLDDIAGDYLCELLFFNVIGDSGDAQRFLRAYTLGLSFDGVPLDRAAGGAIAASVGRSCPEGARPPSLTAAYRALGGADVSGFFQTDGTFRYVIPATVDGALPGETSQHAIYVQNAGLHCATVRLMPTAECGRQATCDVFTLAPGERRTVLGSACGLPKGGTADSDQPLAIVVDSWSVDGPLSSLTAETEQRWDGEAWAPRTGTAGGMMLSAPLVYANVRGWSTGFVVQNLSRATEAEVRVVVLDRGDIINTHKVGRVCPLGAVTILPSELAKFVPSGFTGLVRIESQRWWLPGTTVADLPRLIGHAFGRSTVDPSDGFSYPLVVTGPEVEQRPPAEQVGLLVLPDVMRGGGDGQPSTDLAVANLSTKPGFTDLTIYIFDQNGLLDYICQKLNDEQVEYIDFDSWDWVNPGFRGSAIVSAYFWEHDVFDAKGEWQSNTVQLAVVAATLPRQPPIDPLQPPPALIGGASPSWAMVGIPLTLLQRPPTMPIPLCPGFIPPPPPPRPRLTVTPYGPAPTQRPTVTGTPPTAVPTPTVALPPSSTPPHLPRLAHLAYLPAVHRGLDEPTPRATSLPLTGSDAPGEGGPYLPPGDAVFIPVLGLQGADVPDDMAVTSRSWCSSQVHVMNVDTAPISALFVTWYAPGACGDACDESLGDVLSTYTGLLAPGTRWTFSPESVFAHNGAVFSVRGAKLSAIGVADPGDRWIADALGGALSMAFRGCEGGNAYADFKRAWDADGTYAGIPLGQAKGGAIAVEVDRACPGSADAGVRASASYQGVALHDTVVRAGPDVDLTYALPLVYSSVDTFATTLYLQNASSECASVEVVAQARDDCAQDKPCGRFDIPAGHMVPIDTVRCTGTDWQGSFKVHSSRPLAIVADIAGRDILSTYNAEPLDVHDPDLGTESSAGSRVLYGPLTYSEYQGWDTGVQVFNMSDDYAAKIKVYFFDRSGDIVTTLVDWVCPLGSQTFFLPVVNELSGNWVGSVRVESQDWMNPGGSDIPDHDITAIATLIRYERSDRAKAIAGAAYNLLTESDAFDWRLGHGTGGLESGVGLIALPNVSLPGSSGSRTEIAVTNVVPKPGFTRYTVVLFDANGRVDDVCLDVREKQAVYLDLARWSHLGAPFTGSALISATYWQHDVMDDEGGFVRNLVGLTAAVVQRSGAVLGVDAPGDELSVSTGVPLRGSGAALWAPLLTDAGWRCGFETDHGMLWSPAPALGADAGEVFVPALRAGPAAAATACDATVTVLNLGRNLGTRVGSRDPSEAKVILVAWGPAACPGACAPAVAVQCSGLLRPGGSWRFDASSLPPTAAAATLFSLVPAEADRLCPLLTAAVGADCGRIAAFVNAYRTAGVFEEVSLELGIGPAIVAEVLRDCPAAADASVHTHASYPAITRHDAKAADTQAGSFVYGLPQLGNANGEGRSVAYVQNAGSACATVTLEFTDVDGCEARTCATAAVPKGGMVRLDAEACRSAGRLGGAGRVISDQPLAIVSETAAPRSLSAYRAVTVRDAATLAFAPVTYSEYQGWDAAIHIQNFDRASAARVKVVFLDRSGDIIDTLTDWICPAGAAVVQLDTVHDLAGRWVGTVRVESLARTGDDGRSIPPVAVASVIRMVQGGDVDAADGLSEAVAYNLVTPGFTDTSGLWPAGPLLADGGAVLAVPTFDKGTMGALGGSELAIANLATAPGFTDLSLYVFDANGLVDTICQKLNEQQVEYIDLATWGAIGDGFRGSALISAVFWNHPLRDAGGQQIANQLALGAVLAQRIGTTGKVDVPGDELAMTEAWPVELGDNIVRDLPPASCP